MDKVIEKDQCTCVGEAHSDTKMGNSKLEQTC